MEKLDECPRCGNEYDQRGYDMQCCSCHAVMTKPPASTDTAKGEE